MLDIGTFQQLQNCIVKMERRHEEQLRKIKTNHDQLEARFRSPQGNEHSAHTLLEGILKESHPRCTINTQDNPSLSHMHHVFNTCHFRKWHVCKSMRCPNWRSTLDKAYKLVKPKVHPWWVLQAHAPHLQYVSLHEWHICKSKTLCLQYMSLHEWHVCKSTILRVTLWRDTYAKAYHNISSTCHSMKWQVYKSTP